MRNLVISFSAILLSVALYAATPLPLLGSIADNYYISPDGGLRIPLPFNINDSNNYIVRDTVLARSLNIVLEDSVLKVIHRVELTYPGEKKWQDSVDARLRLQHDIIDRVYPGNSLLIHFDRVKSIHRFLYKQVFDGGVRFHYVQIMPHAGRLLVTWSDFVEAQDTVENEDRIINGMHPALERAQAMALGVGQ